MKRTRGQASLEYMMAIGTLIFVLITLTVYLFTRINESNFVRTGNEVSGVCRTISQQLSFAGYAEGYRGDLRIPVASNGRPFTLAVYRDRIVVDFQGSSCVESYAADGFRYGVLSPPLNLTSGDYWLNNTNGTLYVAKK